MTVIAAANFLKAKVVTGYRVNFVHHGDKPIPYVGPYAHTLHTALESSMPDLLPDVFNTNCFKCDPTFY